MSTGRVLTMEWIIAIAFVSYGAIKKKYWPWPPSLVKVSAAFAVFGIASLAIPEIATGLAGGFLLAAFLNAYQKGLSNYYGGIPLNKDTNGKLSGGLAGALTIPLNNPPE
jgi:hypothetical protein